MQSYHSVTREGVHRNTFENVGEGDCTESWEPVIINKFNMADVELTGLDGTPSPQLSHT